jgi:phenylalanyl-tRNA synthetase beta chain
MPITSEQAESYLSRLGFKPEKVDSDTFHVLSPTWRPDIVREEDLIEELGRVHGYDKIPETMIKGTATMGGPQGFQLWTDWLREAALRAGLSQIISHSLCDLHPLDEPDTGRIGPRTPSSPDMAQLRSSLLTSLAEAARRNNAKEIQIFEIGHVFAGTETEYSEEVRLGMLTAGPTTSAGWSTKEGSTASFFTLKGTLETIFANVGLKPQFVVPVTSDRRLHPMRQARILVGGEDIGFIGQIHPDVAKQASLAVETMLAEISLVPAYAQRELSLDLHPVSRHPATRRDMSVLVDKNVTYEDLALKIQQAGAELLEKQWLFDVFEGQGIPEGKHALGIAIQLRKLDSTFTDEEANRVRDHVVEALAELGATTR